MRSLVGPQRPTYFFRSRRMHLISLNLKTWDWIQGQAYTTGFQLLMSSNGIIQNELWNKILCFVYIIVDFILRSRGIIHMEYTHWKNFVFIISRYQRITSTISLRRNLICYSLC